MKKLPFLLLIALAGLCASPVRAQNVKLSNYYQTHELTAPSAVKLRLADVRKQVQARGGTYKIVYTDVADIPVEKLLGFTRKLSPVAVGRQNTRANELIQVEKRAVEKALLKDPSLRAKLPFLKAAPSAKLKEWDWRSAANLTGTRQQLGGTCWAYAPIACLEASMAVRNGLKQDTSEQYVITNSGAGSIVFPPGGDPGASMQYITDEGTVSESECPDMATQGTPDPGKFKPYGAYTWGVIGNGGQANVADIKAALVEHGPVTTCLYASDGFNYYGNGVVNDGFETKQTNHVVLIVGWSDSKGAWLIKNSWGKNWGDDCGYGDEGGYAWVKYGCRNIGDYSMWVHAHPTYVDDDLFQLSFKELNIKAIPRILKPLKKVAPLNLPNQRL